MTIYFFAAFQPGMLQLCGELLRSIKFHFEGGNRLDEPSIFLRDPHYQIDNLLESLTAEFDLDFIKLRIADNGNAFLVIYYLSAHKLLITMFHNTTRHNQNWYPFVYFLLYCTLVKQQYVHH